MEKTENKKFSPDFLEPTETEIEKARQAVVNKYGVELSHEDAVKFAKLFNELNWWTEIKKDPEIAAQVIDEMKRNRKEMIEEESADSSKILFEKVAKQEKQRIGDEMNAIVNSNAKN